MALRTNSLNKYKCAYFSIPLAKKKKLKTNFVIYILFRKNMYTFILITIKEIFVTFIKIKAMALKYKREKLKICRKIYYKILVYKALWIILITLINKQNLFLILLICLCFLHQIFQYFIY